MSRSLAARDLRRVRRYPSTTVHLLFLPIFFVVVWSRGFSEVARLEGFPARNFLDWIAPLAILNGCTASALICGFVLARDLEGGFFERLLLAPVRPVAVVGGALLSGLARAAVPFVVVTSAAVVFGADLPGGALGLLAEAVAAAGIALCAVGWAVGLALRLRGIRRSVHLMQTGVACTLYLSTGLAPLSFMTGWMRGVAQVNPMTQVLRLARQGYLGPTTWAQTWPGLVVLAAGVALLTWFAVRGLKGLTP
ncbi:MAG TPA: ABC transporter permease [Acidimicrobiales bacterium]|nr:ABC transporter permease [Acidimicrobiales bacterium]